MAASTVPPRYVPSPAAATSPIGSFLTEDHARAAGDRPCGVCLPAAYASWKAQQGSVEGALAIPSGARLMHAAGMDIVGAGRG
jgi:hypothetical protein